MRDIFIDNAFSTTNVIIQCLMAREQCEETPKNIYTNLRKIEMCILYFEDKYNFAKYNIRKKFRPQRGHKFCIPTMQVWKKT